MIYTVGERQNYQKAFRIYNPPMKQGKGIREGEPYAGGAAFATEQDARLFLESRNESGTHEVYGVLADFETVTYQVPGEPARRLLRDAEMVDLRLADTSK